jgi:hypothetical protein
VATCPCAGTITAAAYADLVERTVRGLTRDPRLLLDPLRDRMHALAAVDRFEEAADVRERAAALAQALRRQRRLDALRRAGRVVLALPDRTSLELDCGRLVASRPPDPGPDPLALPLDLADGRVDHAAAPPTAPDDLLLFDDRRAMLLDPLPRHLADELACVAGWLDRNAHDVALVHSEGELASAVAPIGSFEPRDGTRRRRANR